MGEAGDMITQTKVSLSNHLQWFEMHLFNKYLLSIYYVPKHKMTSLKEFAFQGEKEDNYLHN